MRPRLRALVASGYAVAFLLSAMATFDLALRVRPIRVNAITWRIGMIGTLSLQVGTLLLALFIFCLTAYWLGHRRFLRVLAVLSCVLALGALAVLPIFGLDVLQLRRLVKPKARLTMDLTMARAASAVLLAGLSLLWIGVGSWRAATSPRSRKEEAETTAASPLILQSSRPPPEPAVPNR